MSRAVLIAGLLALITAGAEAQGPPPEPTPSPVEASPAPPDASPPPEAEPPSQPVPEPSPVPDGGAGLPLYGPVSSKVFNPDIAVIGNFIAAAGENDVDPRPSFALDEAEASLQAVVDPFARADFFLTFSDEEVGVEEGYVTFTSLPAGLLLKAGKFKASFGKVNTLHPHNLPWADRPLATTNLLGGEEGFNDAGMSLSRLFPNPLVFLEATAEVFRGESEGLFTAPRRRDLTLLGRLRAYRDLSEATNLELGGSFARGTNDTGIGFHTSVFGADATLRWRPLRRAIYRRLLVRGELFWSRREQTEVVGPSLPGEDGPEVLLPATARAFGFYATAEYQIGRRWFAAARYDASERAAHPDLRDRAGSVVLTFWPSEFSQVRGQFRRTSYAEGPRANEVLLQLIFSIGAHGAHPF